MTAFEPGKAEISWLQWPRKVIFFDLSGRRQKEESSKSGIEGSEEPNSKWENSIERVFFLTKMCV